MKLAQHACMVIDELASRRGADGKIPAVRSKEMLCSIGQKPTAGVNLGRVVALLDAACSTEDLPWLGRLIVFEDSSEDFVGKWSSWAPYKPYIVDIAPLFKHWTDEEFSRLRAVVQLLPTDPNAWWEEAFKEGDAWLQRALLVLLRQAYDTPNAP